MLAMSDEHAQSREAPEAPHHHGASLETPSAPAAKALPKPDPLQTRVPAEQEAAAADDEREGLPAAVQAPSAPAEAEGGETGQGPEEEQPVVAEEATAAAAAAAAAAAGAAPSADTASKPPVAPSEKSSALAKAQLRYCTTILKGLKRHPQSLPFQVPVDPVALNIPDYFDIIKNPMDLSTISKKLEAGEYATADDFIANVRLMLSNCFAYNHPDSQVSKMGHSLEKYFNQSITRIPQTLPAHDETAAAASAAAARRKSEGAASAAGPRVRRESHAPSRLTNTQAGHSTPRSRARSAGNPEMAFCGNVLRELLKKTHQAVSWPFLEPVDPVKLGIPDYFDVIKTPMDLSTVKRKLETGQYASAEQFEADVRLIFSNCYAYNAPDSDVVSLCRAFEKIFDAKWDQKPASFGFASGAGASSSLDDFDSDSEKILEINRQIQALQQELNTLLMRRKNRSHSTPSVSGARSKKSAAPRPASSKPAPPPVITEEEFLARPMSFEDKRQLSIEVNNLAPEKLGRVVEIIQAGMALEANGDSDVIELDIESLNTRTLRQLQKYVMECKGITSLAVILGEAPIKRKKPSTSATGAGASLAAGTAPKKANTGAGPNAVAGGTPATAAAAAAAQAMSTDDESSEDDLD